MVQVRGILFDLGETLLDYGAVNMRQLFARGARLAYGYLRELGQPLPAFRWFTLRQLWAVRWQYLKSRLTRREFNSLDVLGRLSREMGQTLTPEQTEQLAWLWYEPLASYATVEDGLGEMLADFRRQGLSLGVVSNTFLPGPVLDRHLAQLRLLEHFSATVYSCDVQFRKPHPEIFRIALERLRLRPEETMFVGDSLAADVAGSRRVGMISVLKAPRHVRQRFGIRPQHRIASLWELPGIVADYNGRPGQPEE